jgi:hypothetical protein
MLSVGAARVPIVTTSSSPRPERPGSLAQGASPAAIRAALLTEDQAALDEAYSKALDQAKRDYDLAALHTTLENWRRQAIAQSDPEAFRLMVRRVAAFYSGEPVPTEEPFAVTRTRAGM